MTYMEIVPDENGDASADTSIEKGLTGGFSFDAESDILSWHDGQEENGNQTNFIRSQHTESQPVEMMINGIPYTVAEADGWGDAWQTVAEILRNGTDIYFKEAEEDPSLYGTGNAWDDITIEGITYEMAAKHGWGDTWREVAGYFGSDYDSYSGSEPYGESPVQESDSNGNGELSDCELTEINGSISSQLAGKWRNAYNQSVSRDLRISNILARSIFPTIKRSGPIATVITEVHFWLVKQGGSPAGSVYTVVIINTSNGDVLSADITA